VVSKRQVGWCDAAERRCRNSESAGEDGRTKVAEKYWYVVTLQRSKSLGACHQCLGRQSRSIDLLRAVTRSRQTEGMLEIREARSLLMYKAFRLCAGIRGRSLDGDGRCKRSIAEEI